MSEDARKITLILIRGLKYTAALLEKLLKGEYK